MELVGTVAVSEIPAQIGKRPLSAENLALIDKATNLADGLALCLKVEDSREGQRVYQMFKGRGFAVKTRGGTNLFVYKNGASA